MLAAIKISHALGVVLILGLGLFVLSKNPKRDINRIYFVLCICIAGWVLGNYMIFVPSINLAFAYRVAILFASLQAPALLLFSWAFPRRNPSISIKHVLLIVIISLFFSSISFSGYYVQDIKFVGEYHYATKFGGMYYLFALYFLFFSAATVSSFLKSYYTLNSLAEKRRIRYFLFGLLMAYSIGITFSLILPTFFKSEKYEFLGPLGAYVFVFFSAYSIVKHRLMDVSVIIRKGLVYSLVIGLITGIYVGFVFLFGRFLQGMTQGAYFSLILFLIIVFAVVFQPLLSLTQQLIDRLFFKSKYEYQQTLKSFSSLLTSIIQLNVLAKTIIEKVTEVIKVDSASILAVNQATGAYEIVHSKKGG